MPLMKQLAIPLSNQKNGSQVAGYKSDKAREKNPSAAVVGICKQDFSRATQYDDEILDFERYL